MYPLCDLTNWQRENILFVPGSKEKKWYRTPEDQRLALFKIPISLTAPTGNDSVELSGEMWSEKIASEIGIALGFNVHHVDIGYIHASSEAIKDFGIKKERLQGDKIFGAVCYSFLNEGKEILIEGADLIMEYDFTYVREKLMGTLEVYSYQLLLRIFDSYDARDKLFEMIVFDTLIGNTDRHQDNFGIIRDEIQRIDTFSPLYDNSSSLGRELTERTIDIMFKDSQRFNAYVHGRKSATHIRWGSLGSFEKKINLFDFLRKVCELTPEIKVVIERVRALTDDTIDYIVYNCPLEVMPNNKKAFVCKLIKYRRDYLLKEF